jgi:hypothetical protein
MATGSKGSIQLRERKNGILVPKRHQMKHLDFLILWFGNQGIRTLENGIGDVWSCVTD